LVIKKLNLSHQPYYSAGAFVISNRSATTLSGLLLALFFALSSISVSHALGSSPQSKPVPSTPSDGEAERDHDDLHHDLLREQYGEVEQVFLPPLVVTNPGGIEGQQLLDSANINPHENLPIDPTSATSNQKTAADSFFIVATVAISTMAAGSIALGVLALRRSVRSSR
jgi:hypothetical protein